jgi:hypothetical protein
LSPPIQTEELIMTVTAPASTQTAESPPPASRRRRVLIAAGIAVLLTAAVAVTAWLLLGTGSQVHTRHAPGRSVIAPRQQATPKLGGSGYAAFCQNNSDLCAVPPSDEAYGQFCQNNSDLCAAPTAPAQPSTAYVQFCQNNSDLCAISKPD